MKRPYHSPRLCVPLPDWSGASLEGAAWRAEDWPVVVGGDGTAGLGTAELWLRLFASVQADSAVATVVVGGDASEVRAAVPGSRWGRTFVVRGAGVGGAFGWCAGYGAVLGAPTEEAWDEFSEAALSALAGRAQTLPGRPSEAGT